MVFSSQLFVFWYLPLALLLYYAAPARGRNLVLTLVSFVFYAWTNPSFLGLLVFVQLVDYACGRILVAGLPAEKDGRLPRLEPGGRRSPGQRWALWVSIGSNLALLGFFKYFNFALDSFNGLVQALGLPGARLDAVVQVALPIGISFYTFQNMSYAIDVYRGAARPVRSLVDFLCFEAMFPQIVAGPIIRFSELADQLQERRHDLVRFARGVAFFSLGLAKKVLLANPCGKVADTTFDAGSVLPLDAWLGAAAYAFQIYFDFSGYSDMAVGLGLMLGFVFGKNFDAPYRAESITDFWRRWHISLSSWLRDYLYLPLGGNRRGVLRTYVNLAGVMLIGGLWHGAAWNFVVWGGLHGAYLCLERAIGRGAPYAFLPRPLRVALTFLLVLVAWVFFRARDLGHAFAYLGDMAGLGPAPAAAGLAAGVLFEPYSLINLALAGLVVWACPQTWSFTGELGLGRAAACLAALWLALAALATQSYNPFIYFMF